jgi:hypothetical protein
MCDAEGQVASTPNLRAVSGLPLLLVLNTCCQWVTSPLSTKYVLSVVYLSS